MYTQNEHPFLLSKKTPFRIVERTVEQLTGLKKLNDLYQYRPKEETISSFLDYTIDALDISYQIDADKIAVIKDNSPYIIVANHPLGGLEGVVLAKELLKHRQDVKILANRYLSRIKELESIFIDVDLFSDEKEKSNAKAFRKALKHLKSGGILLMFPAGEVSSYGQNGLLEDKAWSNALATLLKLSQAKSLPIFIDGKNSRSFYVAGKLHPMFRTLRLGKELLNKNKQTIRFRVGKPINQKDLQSIQSNPKAIVDYLRLSTYILSGSSDIKALDQKKNNIFSSIIKPVDKNDLNQSVKALSDDCLLLSQGQFDVYCINASDANLVMKEIARVREVAFRQVGEGTGKALDIDSFDNYYKQLFVWDREEKAVVGAYRLTETKPVVELYGIGGLYSNTLFHYNQDFLNSLGSSLEIGRSVVTVAYQKNIHSLLLLWKGIAAYINNNPHITHLFGPVSISQDYKPLSRQLIIDTMTRYHYSEHFSKQVKAKVPPPKVSSVFWSEGMLSALADTKILSQLLIQLEEDKGIPVLLKHYLGLNGKLVSFNLDPDFNDVIDGLIMVDLRTVPEKVLGRYMGKENAIRYKNHHTNVMNN